MNLESDTEWRDLAQRALAADLTPRQRGAVEALYGLKGEAAITQKELAAEEGVSQSRIFQAIHTALGKMRAQMQSVGVIRLH